MKLRVGIDVGGTFTDVTAFDEDQGELVAVRKYVSNPAQPAAVMETITADLARDFGPDAVTLILHGSTAALNTLLEGKGVRTGLLTTRGFRDVYEIGRQWRGEEVFNIFAPAPKMLLTRDRIFEIRERLSAQGDVIEPLVAENKAIGATFGVTLGDVVFDDLSVFEPMNRAVALLDIPWYNVIGNHDIAPTLAHVMGFELPAKGTLKGRVIGEALKIAACKHQL